MTAHALTCDPPRRRLIEPVIGRAVFSLSLLSFAMLVAVLRYLETSMPVGGDPWMVGDWLINYGGGFVRRGLFGELFLRWAPGGIAGLWALFAVQVTIYLAIFAYCVRILHRSRYSWSSVALVCSPAGLAFIGWVPSIDAAFRKELLPLLALLLLAASRFPNRGPFAAIALILGSLGTFCLGVFSWEASALLLPAFGYLLLGRGAPHPRLDVFRRSAAAVFVVIGAVGAILSALVHGDVATADAVCAAVRDHGFTGPILCSGGVDASGGAIEAIGWTSYKTAQDLMIAAPVYAGFVVLIVLSFVPVVTSRWFKAHWMWALLIFLGVAPLYFVVTDYGRWTHIIFMALLFCVTADDPTGTESRLWNAPGAIIYTTLWGMPHWMGEAQLGSSWWPFVGAFPTASETVIGRLWRAGGPSGFTAPAAAAAAAAAAADPTVTVEASTATYPELAFDPVFAGSNLEYAWRYLVGVSSNGVDSWFPMGAALQHVQGESAGLYQDVFFDGTVKFQYAPTSLLFAELPNLYWPSDFGWVLNALGWLAVLLTAFGVFLILERFLRNVATTKRWSRAPMTVALLVGCSAATLSFLPVISAWNLGQLQVFVNLLCTWALYAYLRGQSSLAGMALAVAVLMKPHLGLFLVWGLLRRDWRFVIAGLGTGTVGVAASVALYGWGNHVDYLRVLSFLSAHGEVYHHNQSVNGLVQRWVGNGDPLVFDLFRFPDFNPTVFVWTMVGTVAFSAVALIPELLRRKPGDFSSHRGVLGARKPAAPVLTGDLGWAPDVPAQIRGLDFSVALVCFTLASPIVWEHHFGVLLAVFAVAFCTAIRQPRPIAATVTTILVAAYLMTTNLWQPLLPTYGPGMIFLSHMFFGAVLLLACLLVLRWLLVSGERGQAGMGARAEGEKGGRTGVSRAAGAPRRAIS